MSIKPLTLTSPSWVIFYPTSLDWKDWWPAMFSGSIVLYWWLEWRREVIYMNPCRTPVSIYIFFVSEIQYLNFHIKKSPKKYYGNISNSIFFFNFLPWRLQLCEFRWLLLTSCYKHHSKSTKPRNNTAFFGWKSFPTFNKGIVVFGEVI